MVRRFSLLVLGAAFRAVRELTPCVAPHPCHFPRPGVPTFSLFRRLASSSSYRTTPTTPNDVCFHSQTERAEDRPSASRLRGLFRSAAGDKVRPPSPLLPLPPRAALSSLPLPRATRPGGGRKCARAVSRTSPREATELRRFLASVAEHVVAPSRHAGRNSRPPSLRDSAPRVVQWLAACSSSLTHSALFFSPCPPAPPPTAIPHRRRPCAAVAAGVGSRLPQGAYAARRAVCAERRQR